MINNFDFLTHPALGLDLFVGNTVLGLIVYLGPC